MVGCDYPPPPITLGLDVYLNLCRHELWLPNGIPAPESINMQKLSNKDCLQSRNVDCSPIPTKTRAVTKLVPHATDNAPLLEAKNTETMSQNLNNVNKEASVDKSLSTGSSLYKPSFINQNTVSLKFGIPLNFLYVFKFYSLYSLRLM